MSAISADSTQDFLISRIIKTSANGVEVEGHSKASLYNIKTTITKPFTNISQSWHIPYFAQGHINFHGDYGELRAKQILEDLYLIAKYINRKRNMLKAKLDENRQQIERASVGRLTMDKFRSKRTELRKKHRAGQISSIEYQRIIGRMRTEAESLQRRIWSIEEQFWDGYFQTVISMGLRDSIVAILDGKKALV